MAVSASPEIAVAAHPLDSAVQWAKRGPVLVIVLGAVLRLLVALLNLDANDNHLEVIRIIAQENRFPAREEAWQAYQPALYHVTVATIWKVMGGPAVAESKKPWVDPATYRVSVHAVRVAQLVSCGAGLLTLLIVWQFLKQRTLSASARFVAVGFVALNPKLIGISAQATNDSLVILMATLTLYYAYMFFTSWETISGGLALMFAILAGLAKGNGLVVFVAVVATTGLILLFRRGEAESGRGRLRHYAIIFCVTYFAVVPFAGPYWDYYVRHGSPFVLNGPGFVEKGFVTRPGVTSIPAAFATFRLVDMLKEPMITMHASKYPLHRTSLWSHLFGDTHFVHFGAYPTSWQSRHPVVQNLGRAILVVALLPTLLFIWGLLASTLASAYSLLHARVTRGMDEGILLLTVAALGYLGFMVVFCAGHRDFAAMKVTYAFPGLLAFVAMFAHGAERLYEWLDRNGLTVTAVNVTFLILYGLYVADIAVLVYQLRGNALL